LDLVTPTTEEENSMNKLFKRSGLAVAVTGLCLTAGLAQASSHREAPFITEMPKVDGTDFYMFRSYENGRADFVTLIANYLPLQDAYGGPNYFDMDEDAIYEIHVDNSGNAQEDLTFRFQFSDMLNDIQLDVGPDGDTKKVSVPLRNIGDASNADNVQFSQEYTVDVIRGDRRTGTVQTATNASNGTEIFAKPLDNIGVKSFPNGYEGYVNAHIFDIAIPGCSPNGKVFVGQRKEAFAVNLGEIFDLVNTNPLGTRNGEGPGDLADKNVTSFALEVPTTCLTGSANTAMDGSGNPVIGAWTTASVRQARVINPAPMANGKGATVEGGAFTQVSRLGMPLVNEVVIGLKDKDAFNASEPSADGQFIDYVTHPTLPELLEILFGVTAPNNFPRNDLITAFLTGVPDLNMPAGVTGSEMLRLNPAIAATDAGSQNDLGVLGTDNAGFPNGRRPVDDVVDISLRVAMGVLADPVDAPDGSREYTDGVQLDRTELRETFPYLAKPMAGSTNQ
jgi:hypothetical protein